MREIPLSNGGVAVIDDADYEFISRWKWKRHPQGYACRTSWKDGGWICVLMHRIITMPSEGLEVDHRDWNKLNNQRHNLRVVTHATNERNKPISRRNTSGYKGVCWDKRRRKWVAKTKHDGHHVNLGRFEKIEDAVTAYESFVSTLRLEGVQ